MRSSRAVFVIVDQPIARRLQRKGRAMPRRYGDDPFYTLPSAVYPA
jgi:hypothetical protein